MTNAPLAPVSGSDQLVYAVAGGNHVTIELDRSATGGHLDAIEVLAQPGGGPPPHSHAFAEWFLVREGKLTVCEERDGTFICTATLSAGDSVWVAPWMVHGTLNLSDAPARFQVVGQPAAMTGYFAQAGVRVADTNSPRRGAAGPRRSEGDLGTLGDQVLDRPDQHGAITRPDREDCPPVRPTGPMPVMGGIGAVYWLVGVSSKTP